MIIHSNNASGVDRGRANVVPVFVLAAVFAGVGCIPSTTSAHSVVAPRIEASDSDGGAWTSIVSEECKSLNDLWTREVRTHRQCRNDAECMPTGLTNTHYECTAVNAGWWKLEKGRLAGAADACTRVRTESPACCVISCERGLCVTHAQAKDSDYCSADGGTLTCDANARCETNQDRLRCNVALPPDWGFCVKLE